LYLIKGGKMARVRELLSTADVQAVLAVGLTIVVSVLAILGRVDPMIVAEGWLAIIAFYFGQKSAEMTSK